MRDEENHSSKLKASSIHPSSLIPHPSPVAAILLAAGRSRRMGAFKPLLPFGAQTVIETCIDHLLAAGITEIVVVVGHCADELRTRLGHLPVRFALNVKAESEMGVSIARGVEALSVEAKAVIVALGDQPAVTAEEIERVVAAHRQTGARLVVPVWEGRGGHPVLVGLEFRAALLNLDARGGLRALFEAHADEVLHVPVASLFVARDMDTWEDYRALHVEVFGVPPPVTQPGEEA